MTKRNTKTVETEICEGCEERFDIEIMTMEDDGLWLCPACYEECLKMMEEDEGSDE